MKTWKSNILVGVLALAASPLPAAPQDPPAGQGNPASPPASSQAQLQDHPREQDRPDRRHHRRRHHRRHRRHHRRHAAMLLRDPAIQERLGITSEQAARLQAQQRAFVKAIIRDRAELQVKRIELEELLAAEKLDRELIEKKLGELNQAQCAIQRSAIENRLAMREMFTPEQRQKMRQLFWEMRRGGERFGSAAPLGPPSV